MSTDEIRTIVQEVGMGELCELRAGPLVIKADGKSTGERLGAWTDSVQPGDGPPPHTHAADEMFYVIDGRFSFLVDDEWHSVGPGAFVWIPRHTVHAYRCDGPEIGRLLGLVTPAGLEQFYRAQHEVGAETMTDDLYASLAAKHDMLMESNDE